MSSSSGRWRSRHWRPEDTNMQQQQQQQQQHRGGGGNRGGGAEHHYPNNNRYDRNYNNNYNERPSSSWNGRGNYNGDQYNDDGGRFHRRDDDNNMSYRHQQQQQYEPRYHDNNRRPQQQQQQQYYNEMPSRQAATTMDDQRRGGQWQRGQTLSHTNHDRAQYDMRAGDDGRTKNNNNTSNPSIKSHHNNHRATAATTTNPINKERKNAWGKVASSTASKSDGDVKVSLSTTTNNSESTKKSMKQQSSNNAWKKPNTATTASATDVNVKKEFPPLSSSKESSKGEIIPSSGSGVDDDNLKVEMKEEDTHKQQHNAISSPSSTLPTNSSWGKSHSSSLGWASKPLSLSSSSEVVKKKQSAGEEFPSLSASLDAPPLRKQPPQGLPTGDVSLKNGEMTSKKGGASSGSKKSAASTKLASFLLPQLGGEKKKGNTATNNKKQQQHPPSNHGNKAGHTTANNKKKHPRDDTRAPFQHPHHHSATINPATKSTTTTTGAPPIKKGRQRLAPRKKKLTTLKKRVLEERLRVWKERNGEAGVDPGTASAVAGDEADINKSATHQEQNHQAGSSSTSVKNETSTTLLVNNFVNPDEDDLLDDDEHDELVSNLINLAGRVGRVISVFIPRPSSLSLSDDQDDGEEEGGGGGEEESNHVGLSFVRMATYLDANAARDILDGMVVGGQKLHTKILYSIELKVCDDEFGKNALNQNALTASPSEENERQWRLALLKTIVANRTSSSAQDRDMPLCEDGGANAGSQPLFEGTIVFHNILSSDDYEDEDALEESVEDIKSIAGQYGHVVDARGDDAGNVYVTFDTRDIASFAAQKLDGMLLGGVPITVSVDGVKVTDATQQAGSSTVVLDNVLSEDDFEDEDCLNESIEDIRSLAEKYGVVGNLIVDTSNEEEKGKICVEYTGGMAVASEAVKQLNGMMFGGRLISAVLLSSGTIDTNTDDNNATDAVTEDKNVEQEPPQPMFSGDKVIPERFAQCKRVPKVANSGMPRAYASKIADPGAIPLLTEMLGELMRLQQRAKDQKNARSRRRLVMGLREVARGIRAHKVKMVIMANNLDEYGAIDSKLQEILDLSHAEDVPVIFELNKRKLGKAVGKSIKVAVVGIQNVMGAEQQFKQLKRMAGIA